MQCGVPCCAVGVGSGTDEGSETFGIRMIYNNTAKSRKRTRRIEGEVGLAHPVSSSGKGDAINGEIWIADDGSLLHFHEPNLLRVRVRIPNTKGIGQQRSSHAESHGRGALRRRRLKSEEGPGRCQAD